MKYRAALVPALFLVMVCLSVGIAQEPPPAGALPSAPLPAPKYPLSAWKEFKVAEHGFSVSFPAEPEISVEKTANAAGDMTVHTWRISTADGRYQVMAVHFPFEETDPQKITGYFDRTQTLLTNKFNSRPEGIRDFDLKGVPGREFMLQSSASTLRVQLFYRLDRVWILLSDTINRKPVLKEPDIFHSSFRVLPLSVTAGKPDSLADLKGGVPGQVPDGPPPPAGPLFAAPSLKWQTHSSAKGRFTVTLPSDPTEQETEAPSEFGDVKIHVLQSLLLSPLAVCTVLYSDYPDSNAAKKIYEQRQQSLARKGKVMSDTEILLDGYPGSELRMDTGRSPAGPEGRMVNRIFLVGNRIYQVMTVSQKADVDAAELKKFRESFRLNQQK